jgi:hypothetical protein
MLPFGKQQEILELFSVTNPEEPGWRPTQVGLLADLDQGDCFKV